MNRTTCWKRDGVLGRVHAKDSGERFPTGEAFARALRATTGRSAVVDIAV